MFLEMDLPHRLRNIREFKELTRRQVEEFTKGEFKESILAMYESGARKIPLLRLKRLADFYEVSMSFLLGEADSPTENANPLEIDAILMADPDFSDEEKKVLLYLFNLLKAKKKFKKVKKVA